MRDYFKARGTRDHRQTQIAVRWSDAELHENIRTFIKRACDYAFHQPAKEAFLSVDNDGDGKQRLRVWEKSVPQGRKLADGTVDPDSLPPAGNPTVFRPLNSVLLPLKEGPTAVGLLLATQAVGVRIRGVEAFTTLYETIMRKPFLPEVLSLEDGLFFGGLKQVREASPVAPVEAPAEAPAPKPRKRTTKAEV